MKVLVKVLIISLLSAIVAFLTGFIESGCPAADTSSDTFCFSNTFCIPPLCVPNRGFPFKIPINNLSDSVSLFLLNFIFYFFLFTTIFVLYQLISKFNSSRKRSA